MNADNRRGESKPQMNADKRRWRDNVYAIHQGVACWHVARELRLEDPSISSLYYLR